MLYLSVYVAYVMDEMSLGRYIATCQPTNTAYGARFYVSSKLLFAFQT